MAKPLNPESSLPSYKRLVLQTLLGIGVLLSLASLLAWRILVTGVADDYASRGTLEAGRGALRWRADQPVALYQQGVALAVSQPQEAERLWRAAAWTNPTDALVYWALAQQAVETGQQAQALGLAEIADRLGPMRSPALARSADFWLKQRRPDRALARWGVLLRTRPETAKSLFPALLRLAEDPVARPALQGWLNHPPEWWNRFFNYATAKAANIETVVFLYQHRNRAAEDPDEEEQKAYLNRLWKENRWLESYLAWLNGLNPQQSQALGYLYNGSFEVTPTHFGFDWQFFSPRGATVEALETYGAHGNKALHIRFNGERIRFQHVSQYLVLDPGRYRLQGRVRPDQLKAERGLRWRLRCVGSETLLVDSEPFSGLEEWRGFSMDFTIPAQNCVAQLLRLELDGRVALDFEAEGEIWFDNLSVARLD